MQTYVSNFTLLYMLNINGWMAVLKKMIH